jgi:pimeloyl-ACP methyl ester carboxylesterase
VRLNVERLRSGRSKPGALLVLAGGPGQGASTVADGLADALAPVLGDRELIVFDQRGTGRSGALDCPPLQRAAKDGGDEADARSVELARRCGEQLGPRRAFYTSTESVADIDAVRSALGFARIGLYGVSYGTYVAQRYARAHPDRLDRLVLDSTVPQDGATAYQLASFAAVGRVLRALCARAACRGVSTDPVSDVAALVAKLRGGPLRGRVYSARGTPRAVSLSRSADLFDLLVAGDLNPVVRALFPAAVRAALRGDGAPLLRLAATGGSGPVEALESLSVGLFAATTCQETPLPWAGPAAPLAPRASQAQAALDAISERAFAPFDRAAAVGQGGTLLCRRWPVTAVAPPPAPAVLSVPTLIVGGEDDLRTPVEEGRRAAALIPGASVVSVAGLGHSVVGQDATGCVDEALRRFFVGRPVGSPCAGKRDETVGVRAIPPTALRKVVPIRGLERRTGQTLGAVIDGLDDVNLQALLRELAGASAPVRGGGLRGGAWFVDDRATTLSISVERLVYVPGVTVSGTVRIRAGKLSGGSLRVGGRDAARGTLRFGRNGRISGTLGGSRIGGRLASAAEAPSFGSERRGLRRPLALTPWP